MKKSARKIICAALAALLVIGAVPLSAMAEETWSPAEISGSYSYTTNEGEINQQGSDTFVYRDRCFMRSSYLGCEHLATLSAQVAISSASRWGDDIDPDYTDDPSRNAQNLVAMLSDMGFSDVETNKYYTLEKQENSAGVAVGSRQIKADGKDYTLLAVIPRSANYKQEWAGNFTVGGGDYHEGFKQGRDEILRFVKKYIADHKIQGDLKIWITGHSRGAALSNSLGGFFAGGGAAYFDTVTITPENVYCYTYATPRTVKESVSKKAYLSVSGPREDPVYANDTQTPGYTCPEDGTLDPRDAVFDCIKNYPLPYDFITMLPPETWGFTWFGSVESYDLDGKVTAEEMLEELKTFAPFAYEEFVNGGDFRSFSVKTFDLALLEVVDDPSVTEDVTMAQFIRERVLGLAHLATGNDVYTAEGYQEVLKAVAGLYGMLHGFKSIELDGAEDLLIEPLVLAYIAYGRDQLKAEGRLAPDATDEEAATAVLCDLLSYATGTEITGTTLTDTAFTAVIAYLTEREGSPLYNAAISAMSGLLPAEGVGADMVKTILKMFVTDPEASTEEELSAILKACVNGPAEGTQAYQDGGTAETVRAIVYTALGLASTELGNAIGYGYSPVSALASYALGALMVKEKDEDGNPLTYYATLDEAADAKMATALQAVVMPLVEKHSGKYGAQFDEQLANHLNTVLSGDNVRKLRNIVLSMLMYTEGEPFAAETAVRNAATFIGCAGMIPLAHYNEVNVAWCKAIGKKLSDVAPEAKEQKEDGTAKTLVTPGKAREGGTMVYALGRDDLTAPADGAFSEKIPTATEGGVYYVWYQVVDASGARSEADCVEAEIIGTAHGSPTTGDPGVALPLLLMAIFASGILLTLRKKNRA